MIVAIDDTDSRAGGCTTYIASLVVQRFRESVAGYPLLVRLNPTIPHKTRGNGAVAIRFKADLPDDACAKIRDFVIDTVSRLSYTDDENTNPGVVFLNENGGYGDILANFPMRAVQDVIEIREAKAIIKDEGIESFHLKNGRGLIGALAAGTFCLYGVPDATFELILYRVQEKWGTPRFVDKNSMIAAHRAFYPLIWDTYDEVNDILVGVPRSADPVLFGIRGDDVDAINRASDLVVHEMELGRQMFLTNQGTDAHLIHVDGIADLRDFHSYVISGRVSVAPVTIEGGHVIFKITDDAGESLDCAAFEPTKEFRHTVRQLAAGDVVTVSGSVKSGTLNIEKMHVDKTAAVFESGNPVCPSCGKRMKSAGAGQGYRCRKCKTKMTKTTAGEGESGRVEVEREIRKGWYEVPPCARRHLAKPLVRDTFS